MIPKKIELTNFLSYRETVELDFEGIHLACISGANGAGKSSILDAITWSLFGRSRSRSDDDIVNRLAAIRGAPAEVRFTFSLEGTDYRVQRSKRAGKSSSLELQISSGNGKWKTLSESKIRETQLEIEKILKLNFDTFTNSSLLLQGKADEFTTKTPNQRKEILANLLGVTEWDHYKDLAAEARKVEQGKISIIDSRLEDISQELKEESERTTALKEARDIQSGIAEKLNLQNQILDRMRETSNLADKQENLVNSLKNSSNRIQENLAVSQSNYQKREEEKETYQTIIANEKSREENYKSWQEAVQEAQEWQEKANTYNRYLQEKQPFDLQIAASRSRLEQQKAQLEEQQKKVNDAAIRLPLMNKEFQADSTKLVELKNQIQSLEAFEEELNQARTKYQQIIADRRLLQQEHNQLIKIKAEIETLKSQKNDIIKNKNSTQENLTALEVRLNGLVVEEKKYHELRRDLENIKPQQELLRKEMDKLKARIQQLENSKDDSECPLCSQPLTEEHRQQVIKDLSLDGKERGDIYRSNLSMEKELNIHIPKLEKNIKIKPQVEKDLQYQQQRFAQAEARLMEIDHRIEAWVSSGKSRLEEIEIQLNEDLVYNEAEARVKDLETKLTPKEQFLSEQETLRQKTTKHQAQISQLKELINAWENEGIRQLNTINTQLNENDYALDARDAIKKLQRKIDQVKYDPAADKAAKEKRDSLAGANQDYQELKQAQAAVKPLEDTLIDLQKQIAEQKEALLEQENQLAGAQSQLEDLRAAIVDMTKVEDEVNNLREQEIKASRGVGRAEQILEVLDDLRELQARLEEEKTGLALRVQRLKLLEKSFGRDGVQALLIESALPEIEERANQLIDRLTGGSMTILFETQRKLKTRDELSETLDIRIADKDGERPYENYSGGEQFRVNFAIRLALSQLLAHRSGARLQTLIIDEGFGSQDPLGRQRLVEAINTVSDDFTCILVITHVDDLRDAFPNRIEVSKSLEGSKINVV